MSIVCEPFVRTRTAARDHRFVSQLTRNAFALVLAGGRGGELKHLTEWRAKPAVPFGGKFRIVDFTLSNCVNSGIRRIGVATQYKAQSLIRHIQRGWSFLDGRFGEMIDIMPAQQNIDETRWYLGTADAVFQNLDVLRRNRPEHVLILSGDHIYKMDYGRMLAAHAESGADMSIACVEVPASQASDFGIMGLDADERVIRFAEKPKTAECIPGHPGHALASMGVYVFNAEFLYEQLVRDHADPKSSHDFGRDIIPHCVPRHKVWAHRFSESCVGNPGFAPYWRDVGTIDAYWEANMELIKVIPELNLYDEDWPVWTEQEQVPPVKFIFDDDGRRGCTIDSMVAGGCIVSGAEVYRSMLFSRVRVNDHSRVEDSLLLPSVVVGQRCVLRKVVVDKGCVIPDGTVIGVNPEDDRRRFHVTSSGVTLVTPEMLGQRVHFLR